MQLGINLTMWGPGSTELVSPDLVVAASPATGNLYDPSITTTIAGGAFLAPGTVLVPLAEGSGPLGVSLAYYGGSTENATVTFLAGEATPATIRTDPAKVLSVIYLTIPPALANVRVIQSTRPGFADDFPALYQGKASAPALVFHPDYLASLAPFACLRFMDLLETNNSLLTSWALRNVPGPGYTLKPGLGVPYEWLCHLASTLNKPSWWNVITLFDDASIAAMATLLRDQITPGLPKILEVDNETWNPGFGAYQRYLSAGQAAFGPGLDPATAVARQTGRQTARILWIFAGIFGTRASELTFALGGRDGLPVDQQAAYEQMLADLGGRLPNGVKVVPSSAPYFMPYRTSDPPSTFSGATFLGPSRGGFVDADPAAVAITSSGSTAKVTCKNHGVATGDVVQVLMAAPPGYNGQFPATVIDPDTFTVPLAAPIASPATPLLSYQPISLVKNPPFCRVLTSWSYDGETLTVKAPLHGWKTGQAVKLCNFGESAGPYLSVFPPATMPLPPGFRTFNDVFTLTVLDPNTFTVPIATKFDPGDGTQYTAYAWDLAALDPLFEDLADDISYTGLHASWQVNYARSIGTEYVCYESGQSIQPESSLANVPPVADLYSQANRDPRMGALYDGPYYPALKNAKVALANHFNSTGPSSKWGSWGAREHPRQPVAAPKWTALLSLLSQLSNSEIPTMQTTLQAAQDQVKATRDKASASQSALNALTAQVTSATTARDTDQAAAAAAQAARDKVAQQTPTGTAAICADGTVLVVANGQVLELAQEAAAAISGDNGAAS